MNSADAVKAAAKTPALERVPPGEPEAASQASATFLPGLLPEIGAGRPSTHPLEPIEQLRRARTAGYSRLDFLIATVPDPIDSSFAEDFDAYVAAIRLALEAAGYVSDLFFDPWSLDARARDGSGDTAEGGPTGDRHRSNPGVLLFRRRVPSPHGTAQSHLLAVLLVGESPTWGVHKAALTRSLDMIDEICGSRARAAVRSEEIAQFCGDDSDGSSRPIRLLGPSSSGAADSIRMTIEAWLVEHLTPQPLAAPPTYSFEIRSGSATARNTREILETDLPAAVRNRTGWKVPVDFRATVNHDDALWAFVRDYLICELGAHPNEIAVLTESNTSYGNEFRSIEKSKAPGPREATPCRGPVLAEDKERPERQRMPNPGQETAPREIPLTLAFPLHISQVRRQRDLSAERREVHPGLEAPHKVLSLGGRTNRQHIDTLDVHSPLTTNLTDQALADLLHTLATEPVRFVAILASDVLDGIFLAGEVHEEFPQVTLVLLTSNLLYLHEDLAFLNGALVASTYPLGGWTKRMSFPFAGDELRLLFSSEYAEGTYNAALLLTEDLRQNEIEDARDYLDYDLPFASPASTTEPFAPPLWMSLIENGQFWPLKSSRAELDGYVQRVTMVPDQSGMRDRDRARAWTPPDMSIFEWTGAVLAVLALAVCGAYSSTRRRTGGWPLASRRILYLIAPAPRFPHSGMHRFALFVTFFVLCVVQIGTCAPLAVHTYLRVVTGCRCWAAFALCFLTGSALVASLAHLLRTFTDWMGTLLRVSRAPASRLGRLFGRMPARSSYILRRASRRSRPFLLSGAVVTLIAVVTAVMWMRKHGVGEFDPSPAALELALLVLRTQALGGPSLMGAVGLLGLTTLVWTLAHLRQVRLHQHALRLRDWGILPPYGTAHDLFDNLGLKRPIDGLLERVASVWPSARTLVVMIVFDAFACVVASRIVIFDHLPGHLERALPYVFVLLMGILSWGCARALGTWRELRQLLSAAAVFPMTPAVERLPRALLEAFRNPLSDEIERVWRGYCQHLSQHLSFKLANESDLAGPDLHRRIISLEAEELRSSWRRSFGRQSLTGDAAPVDPWVELVGLRMIAFVGYIRAHVYNGIGTVTAATLPLLWLTTMYPFNSSRVLLALALGLVLCSVATSLLVLTQMNRNETLSRLEGSEPGHFTWDSSFVSALILHGALPLAAFVSVKFPALGRTMTDWIFALVHGLGAG